MMLVLVSFLICMGSFVSGDLTLGLKEGADTMIAASCTEKERRALLSLKANLDDEFGYLNGWGSEKENRNCCKWWGVSCNNHTHHVIRLDLSAHSEYGMPGKNITPFLPDLHQLEYLDLSGIDFQFNPIPIFLGSLTNLRHLDLSSTNLKGPIPHQLANLSNLLHLNLSHNLLKGSIPFSFGELTSLTHLDLSKNQLEGFIPKSLGKCSSLVRLDLSENHFNGLLPKFVGCSSLKELILHHNNLYGGVPNFTGCSSLKSLSLGHNLLNGSIPDFTVCQSLRKLDLSNNRLTGNLTSSVGQLSNLEYLDVSSNSLEGVISDVHFLNLTYLTYLDMSFNSFTFKLSFHGMIIPFQLETIRLQSCNLGPSFPAWIQKQRQFRHLDISSAQISDSVPAWFWNLPPGLKFLNLSSNEIKGMLPNMTSEFVRYPGMDMSYNQLEGRIPLLPSRLAAINLSGNKFTGTLTFLCEIDAGLTFLDLSNNLFSGRLPDCWLKFQETLLVLNLSNNTLRGEIPSSLGFLTHLEALYLRANAFVGELPISLSNCTKLRFADFGENKLSGIIPAWIGEKLSELSFLVLRSNRFYGSLASQLCWLNNLQFLDLSKNGLSGNIPWCIGNFTAMATRRYGDDTTNHSYLFYDGKPFHRDPTSKFIPFLGGLICGKLVSCYAESAIFIDNALVEWKGTEREFGRGLGLLKSIDLSSNMLSGKLPYEITSLHELVSLNLSRNKLHGELPKQMGLLKSLDSLDLSRNEFSDIPSSLSEISFLSYLDLSNNKLSGRIPSGTQLQRFNSSVYSGNLHLCGPPLTPRCGLPPSPFVVGREDDDDEEEEDGDDLWKSYYIGMGVGFGVGFWGICAPLFLNRRCRYFFFASLSYIKDSIYVTVAVHFRKLQRNFRRF